ncbi:Dabb family protein [Candidatus Roizmanbacteria bacterium]|nr:Dabb family protein [Candidatus Roizmanbacteria bacterium]
MVKHIVFFKFYENTSPKPVEELAKALEKLKDQIPGVTHYVWGPSISIEHLEKGYTHGFIMTFKDKRSRDNYVPHPLHKALIKKYVDPICEQGLVFDIEE